MPSSTKMLALAAAASTASAFQGFNYGATYQDGRLRVQQDFEELFSTAQKLEGTDGKFNSARLYTMIQGDTDNQPISAIPAAIKTKTSILFGLWASAGQDAFNNEIEALEKTIDQYCDSLDGLVAGISVGSEDLYRDSPIGIEAGEFNGVGPKVLIDYIKKVRETIKGTCMSDAPIGHVDTWTAFVNETNKPLIEACDWVGMDAYPYFEDTKPNAIEEAKDLFNQALANTKGAAGDKDVWITETGYPTSGKKSGDAVANTKNARTYWEEVGCPLFGNVNTWWYTLQDSNSDGPVTDDTPSFGVVGDELSSKPKYNLSCKNVDSKPSSSSSSTSKPEPTSSKGGNGGSGGNGDSIKEPVETETSSDVEETTTKEPATQESATEAPTDDAVETATTEEVVPTPSGISTVSVPVVVPTPTPSSGGSDNGNDGDDSSDGGDDSQGGGDDGDDGEQVPTDGGSNQLKGSFGAVVIALALTFFAL